MNTVNTQHIYPLIQIINEVIHVLNTSPFDKNDMLRSIGQPICDLFTTSLCAKSES
jgi:hypothetical protein